MYAKYNLACGLQPRCSVGHGARKGAECTPHLRGAAPSATWSPAALMSQRRAEHMIVSPKCRSRSPLPLSWPCNVSQFSDVHWTLLAEVHNKLSTLHKVVVSGVLSSLHRTLLGVSFTLRTVQVPRCEPCHFGHPGVEMSPLQTCPCEPGCMLQYLHFSVLVGHPTSCPSWKAEVASSELLVCVAQLFAAAVQHHMCWPCIAVHDRAHAKCRRLHGMQAAMSPCNQGCRSLMCAETVTSLA